MAARLANKEWPVPVVEFYLGQRSMDDMFKAAAGSRGNECEARFYAGEWHLLRGARAEAISALRSAVEECPKDFTESGAAAAELNRLKP